MNLDPRALQLADFAHRIELPVRWGDIDMLGHVNNAKFFTYDESSRIQYFEALAEHDPRMWKDYGLILANIGADFIAQVHYPAKLVIGTRIAKIGRSSMTTLSGLFLGDTVVAAVRGTVVWFDYVNQKSSPVPEHVRQWIAEREIIKPDQG